MCWSVTDPPLPMPHDLPSPALAATTCWLVWGLISADADFAIRQQPGEGGGPSRGPSPCLVSCSRGRKPWPAASWLSAHFLANSRDLHLLIMATGIRSARQPLLPQNGRCSLTTFRSSLIPLLYDQVSPRDQRAGCLGGPPTGPEAWTATANRLDIQHALLHVVTDAPLASRRRHRRLWRQGAAQGVSRCRCLSESSLESTHLWL